MRVLYPFYLFSCQMYALCHSWVWKSGWSSDPNPPHLYDYLSASSIELQRDGFSDWILCCDLAAYIDCGKCIELMWMNCYIVELSLFVEAYLIFI